MESSRLFQLDGVVTGSSFWFAEWRPEGFNFLLSSISVVTLKSGWKKKNDRIFARYGSKIRSHRGVPSTELSTEFL